MSTYTPYLVSNFSSDPSVTIGALTRAQWQDYQARFVPIENRLMDLTTYNNPELAAAQVSDAMSSAGAAVDTANQNRELNRAQYGLTARAGQQQLEARQDSVTRATASMDAANKTRQALIDRNRMIAVGGIPNAGRAYGLSTEA